MPAEYSIDKQRRLVISRLWGPVTEDEVFEHNRKLRSDPNFDPSFSQLADMSGVTEIRVGTATIQSTSRDQFFTPGARRAFVASTDGAYGMARMFALQAESVGQRIEVFREKRQAEEYLGMDTDKATAH